MTQANLPTQSYAEQAKQWPESGRHILAHHDDETVMVYQAYRPEIGNFAARNGYFGGEFLYSRMSWIKPNFLWMMYRSNWGQARGQEVILAVRLTRSFFDRLLEQAVPSSYSPKLYTDRREWQAAVGSSDVRLQWDPDHLPTGDKCERRAIQIGLRGAALEAYGKHEPVEIIDMSSFVAQQRQHATSWQSGQLEIPIETVYMPANPQTAIRLGVISTPG